MDLQLQGRRALVTGGSRGIGKAVAAALIAEGAVVTICARHREAVESAAAELGATAVVADTGSDESVRELVAGAIEAMGGIDILVNAAATPAGQAPPLSLPEITSEALLAEVNIKVLGYLRCAQAVAPGMVERGWGRIISISGLAARSTGSTIGSIRNVAVAAMTKNLADELGRSGVNVTVVHPGLTRTEATPGWSRHGRQPRCRHCGGRVPAGRAQLHRPAGERRRDRSRGDLSGLAAQRGDQR